MNKPTNGITIITNYHNCKDNCKTNFNEVSSYVASYLHKSLFEMLLIIKFRVSAPNTNACFWLKLKGE